MSRILGFGLFVVLRYLLNVACKECGLARSVASVDRKRSFDCLVKVALKAGWLG